jgi:hypothetical protein
VRPFASHRKDEAVQKLRAVARDETDAVRMLHGRTLSADQGLQHAAVRLTLLTRVDPMSVIFAATVIFFACVRLPAQSEAPSPTPVSNAAIANRNQDPQDAPDQKEMERIAFARRSRAVLPENPKPQGKGSNEDKACPAGEGNPCALLGGWRYYSDQWHITEHEATWWSALETPGMTFATATLFTATVIDIEGTQHCLGAETCRELNPLMGKTRAQQYGVAIPMDSLLTWAAVREKRHGRGILPFFMMWTINSVHLYYGINGLRPQGHV